MDGGVDTREYAEDYLGIGWVPIPIPYGTKGGSEMGSWKGTTRENALSRFASPANVGVLLGAPSGNLLDVDIDTPNRAGAFLADRLLPPTESVFGRAGKPRSHRLYYDANEVTTIRRVRFLDYGTRELNIELRGTGHYTVFPPSLHPAGEFYAWDECGDIWQTDPRRLLAALGEMNALLNLARVWQPGRRHDPVLALAGALRHAGWGEARTRAFVGLLCEAAGDPDVEDRMNAVRSTYERDDNVTGWPTLARLIGGEMTRALRADLGVRDDPTVERPATAGLSVTNAAALQGEDFPEPAWPIPGLIGGGLTLLVGKPKGGKSFLSLQAGVAIASGLPALGSLPATEGAVVYYALEDTPPRLQRRLRAMLGDQPWPERLVFVTGSVAGEGELHAHLLAMIAQHQPLLLIVDTLGMVRNQQQEGNAFLSDYKSMSMLKGIADASGTNLLVVHHVRKNSDDDDLMTASSGTFGITAAADTVLRIRKHGEGKRLEVVGRDVEPTEWDIRFDGGVQSWVVGDIVEDKEDTGSNRPARRRDDERNRMRVVTYLLRRDDEEPLAWVRRADITGNVALSDTAVGRILAELVDEGHVEQRRNLGYRIIRDERAQQVALEV